MALVPSAEEVRRRIVEHGLSIRDKVVETLPHSYGLVVEQVKSISRVYKGDFETYLSSLSNVKGLDLLVIYAALVAALYSRRPIGEEELRKLAGAFEANVYDVVSASKLRRALEAVGVEREVADETISNLLRMLNVVGVRYKSPYLWVAKQRRLPKFEKEVRDFIFRGRGGGRVGRGVKLFLRLFIHETNIPLALRIAYTPEYRKYILHGDMYTALVTLRSGAFEDVTTLTAERIRARVAKRILCEAREGGPRCRDVVFRLESVRGLVRYVGKISGDPVLYERGAYDIGARYCRDLKCDSCPIRDVCRRYTFIKLK
ncbi:hypothetical protein [Pyrobaculum neutrophilum]|uniref:Uncharacterized protein n=1 Tax=Pyrobaculum neutrophilum (strain DSM 2338 / JCM 9278 / NBRC 100436 / V24Sta) TaxID=444157 RepID=B1YA27_PYRNV|nr:conserved hypothetical protein [Pyrobaculum neutrophilum V24Sta]